MRIDDIKNLKQKCTGCMACVDTCVTNCISHIIGDDGFSYSLIDESKCISCGKCYSVCPIETHKKHVEEQHLFAAYALDTAKHNRGSSGGIFELLAEVFSEQGYYIVGAAFDGLTLKHQIVNPGESVKPLLKSKYIQSDTDGIFNSVIDLLKNGNRVFFSGTPCQVSALINSTPKHFQDRLFTADIICHGVPSQKTFDDYIKTLESKHNAKVLDFSFRVKDNSYKHVHGYSYNIERDGKTSTINGIYAKSSFYNAFKNYLFFRDSCYDCQYSTLDRVSDITLADFWGIEKYDFECNADSGVSMIITNSEKGYKAFSEIKGKTSKEFPIQYGVDSNYCLTHTTKKPENRDSIISELSENGYEQTSNKYFGCSLVHKIYWLIPRNIRNLIKKLRG